jgi:hypothetical protein
MAQAGQTILMHSTPRHVQSHHSFGMTHDGLHWEALPPPLMAHKEVHWAEVGAVEYAPFGITQTGAYFYDDVLCRREDDELCRVTRRALARRQEKILFLPSVKKSAYFARFFRGKCSDHPPGLWHLHVHRSLKEGRIYSRQMHKAHSGWHGGHQTIVSRGLCRLSRSTRQVAS